VPSLATLISRAAARYLGVNAQTVARELARAATREHRASPDESTRAVPSLTADGRAARCVFVVWLAGLALFGLVVVNVDLFLPQQTSNVFRLVVGAVLLTEGAGLLVRRWPFRPVLLARLTARSRQHPSRIRRTARKHLVGSGLTLLGFAWLAAGLLDLLRGVIALL
jgi:hypothetical protein